jgi:hypothetical protein
MKGSGDEGMVKIQVGRQQLLKRKGDGSEDRKSEV